MILFFIASFLRFCGELMCYCNILLPKKRKLFLYRHKLVSNQCLRPAKALMRQGIGHTASLISDPINLNKLLGKKILKNISLQTITNDVCVMFTDPSNSSPACSHTKGG